jgi:hypothetical protein
MRFENGRFVLESFRDRLLLVVVVLAVSSVAIWYIYLPLVLLALFIVAWLYSRTTK